MARRTRKGNFDNVDKTILHALQKDCRISLEKLAAKAGVPKSTVFYRIKKHEKDGLIEGYHARLNAENLGYDYLAVVLVRAKYGPHYHEQVGKKLAQIPGVWSIYYVLGEIDFVVLIRATDRNDYMDKLAKMSSLADIERTSTQVIAKVVKNDPRIELN
jgi:Lrp/AsnC family leucine-responsive transcriptional regulator